MEEIATFDFETRTPAPIKRTGAYVYSQHPETEVLCLSFALPGDAHPTLWHSGYQKPRAHKKALIEWNPGNKIWLPKDLPHGTRPLEDLFDWIRDGNLVEAHNAFFEWCIWTNVFTLPQTDDDGRRGVEAPPIRDEQWRCSAAKAAAYGLPRHLDGAGRALGLDIAKDKEGTMVMRKLTKPRSPLKSERERFYNEGLPEDQWPTLYHEDGALYEKLYAYCIQDVRAEHAMSSVVPDLDEVEQRVWLADFKANGRGIRIDQDLCKAAIELSDQQERELNQELKALSGIPSGTLRGKIKEWLEEKHGLSLTGTDGATLDWVQKTDQYKALPSDAQRVVQIAREINRTSVTKFQRMLDMRGRDGRVRELVRYHGAATGRWSGSGIQVQNFPRGDLGKMTMEQACYDVLTCDLEWCRTVHGDVLKLLSSVARGALLPSVGKLLYVADYSAIEACVLLWLAGETESVELMRGGGDVYCVMASDIYRRLITKADKRERLLGKVTVLALGYGMGFVTALLTIRMPAFGALSFTVEEAREIIGSRYNEYMEWVRRRLFPTRGDFRDDANGRQRYGIFSKMARRERGRITSHNEDAHAVTHELAVCKFLVDRYRDRMSKVQAYWSQTEEWAIQATLCPGETFGDDKIQWVCKDNKLFCQLPSGRPLIYQRPKVTVRTNDWGMTGPELSYWGVHKMTKQWAELRTYGGKLVENATQALARDIMRYAILEIDEHDVYDLITSVHDEALAEADERGDMDEFEDIMVRRLPEELRGIPVRVEGGVLKRYQK